MDEYKNRPKTLSGQVKQAWLQHQFNILLGFGISIALLFVYHFFSDGDFSFLMTLGSLLVLFGFCLLAAKALLTRKLSHVSFKTLQAYALVFAARLCSILFYEGYLPYDKSGDWFYQAVEVSALVLVVGLLACIQLRVARHAERADTFDKPLSSSLRTPTEAGVLLLVVPALLLAMVLHPSLNNNWLTDVAWTFALYLEAVAIYPQIHVFGNAKEEIEPLELNYVFFLAVARLLHFVFWVSSYQELNDKTSASLNKKFPGYFVVGSQLVNLALLSDFTINHLTMASQAKGYLPMHV